MPLEVNRPDVVADVTAVFDRYEAALVGNDVDTLDELFWDSPELVRFGLADRQQGFAQVSAFRRSLARQTPPRGPRNTVVTTIGTDLALVTTEFVPDGQPVIGRQSQTWLRIDGAWRVVTAHVSWLAG
jgi:hypothetical protein